MRVTADGQRVVGRSLVSGPDIRGVSAAVHQADARQHFGERRGWRKRGWKPNTWGLKTGKRKPPVIFPGSRFSLLKHRVKAILSPTISRAQALDFVEYVVTKRKAPAGEHGGGNATK
jgi:hypothetical protein